MDLKSLTDANVRHLSRSLMKLKTYDGSIMIPKDEVKLQCEHEDKSNELNFEIPDKLVTPLLSADTCLKLGSLKLNVETIKEIPLRYSKQRSAGTIIMCFRLFKFS